MIFKNRSGQGVILFAWDTVTNVGVGGDALNLTGMIGLDGNVAAEMDATANNTLVEVGGGGYYAPLLQAETNANSIFVFGSSVTANVVVDPIMISTTAGAIPMEAHSGEGGLPTVNAANQIAGIAGAVVNTLDALAGTNFGTQYQLDKMSSLQEQYDFLKGLFDTETWAELTSMPPGTPTTIQLLMLLYSQARWKLDDDRNAGQQTIHNSLDSPIGIAARSDDGSVFTREKFVDAS